MIEKTVCDAYAVLMAEIRQRSEDAATDYLYNDIGPLLYAYASAPEAEGCPGAVLEAA